MVKNLLRPIMEIKDVRGVILLSLDGDCLHKTLSPESHYAIADDDWKSHVIIFKNILEAELVFEEILLYVRKHETGYLVVVAGKQASPPMVRLSCDMVISELMPNQPTSKWKRIFKRK